MTVKLRPQWTSKTKPARDAEGWERGAKGIDGAWDKDSKDWVGTWNANADKAIYGPLAPKHGRHPTEKPGS
jgi:hypothetical protein